MKRALSILIVVLICLSLAGFANAQNVPRTASFAWQQATADTNSGSFGGWKIYRKTTVGGVAAYTLFATVPFVSTQTEYTSFQSIELPAGSQGTIVFVATAFDTAGNQSAYSNEASYTYDLVPPTGPTLFKLTVTVTVTP
jgi:hypothetical protein